MRNVASPEYAATTPLIVSSNRRAGGEDRVRVEHDGVLDPRPLRAEAAGERLSRAPSDVNHTESRRSNGLDQRGLVWADLERDDEPRGFEGLGGDEPQLSGPDDVLETEGEGARRDAVRKQRGAARDRGLEGGVSLPAVTGDVQVLRAHERNRRRITLVRDLMRNQLDLRSPGTDPRRGAEIAQSQSAFLVRTQHVVGFENEVERDSFVGGRCFQATDLPSDGSDGVAEAVTREQRKGLVGQRAGAKAKREMVIP